MPRQENATIRIWDPFVRFSHWILVVAFFIAYFSEDELLSLHVWAGYVLGVIVLLRIVWGVLGPRHARFSDFLYRPTEVVTYMRELLSFRGKRYLGHSPAGGAMVERLPEFFQMEPLPPHETVFDVDSEAIKKELDIKLKP